MSNQIPIKATDSKKKKWEFYKTVTIPTEPRITKTGTKQKNTSEACCRAL